MSTTATDPGQKRVFCDRFVWILWRGIRHNEETAAAAAVAAAGDGGGGYPFKDRRRDRPRSSFDIYIFFFSSLHSMTTSICSFFSSFPFPCLRKNTILEVVAIAFPCKKKKRKKSAFFLLWLPY